MTTNVTSRATSGENTAPTGSGTNSGSGAAAPKTDVTKNEFLQLLVAQLRHQDPMKPADGTQFLTQLAQFEQLEQSLNIGQDVTAIREALVPTASGDKQTS